MRVEADWRKGTENIGRRDELNALYKLHARG